MDAVAGLCITIRICGGLPVRSATMSTEIPCGPAGHWEEHGSQLICGSISPLRKSVLQQVGGYDRDTFAEDCDLTLKLLMRGWHVAYEPRAIGWVETPSSLLNLLQQRYRWTRGILQATVKHSHALWQPRKAGVNCYILWYMQ